jgi:hypothetical protein
MSLMLTTDRRRALSALAAACICILTFAILFGDKHHFSIQSPQATEPADLIAPYSTGTIVFVPSAGNDCRELLIDNATWRIRENGYTDCDTILSQMRPIEGQLTVISDSFKAK